MKYLRIAMKKFIFPVARKQYQEFYLIKIYDFRVNFNVLRKLDF